VTRSNVHADRGIALLGRLEQRAAIFEKVQVELMDLDPLSEKVRPATLLSGLASE